MQIQFIGESHPRRVRLECLANGIVQVQAVKEDGEYHRLVITPHDDAGSRLATPEVEPTLRDLAAEAVGAWQTEERVALYNEQQAALAEQEE